MALPLGLLGAGLALRLLLAFVVLLDAWLVVVLRPRPRIVRTAGSAEAIAATAS